MHKVLKPFRYAHDGIEAEKVEVGVERDFRHEVADGLVKAGYLELIEGKGPLPPQQQPKPEPTPGEGSEPPPVQPPAADDRTSREAEAAAIAIPDDWEKLNGNDLKKLGAALSKNKMVAKDDAIEAIKQELAWRAADAAAATQPPVQA